MNPRRPVIVLAVLSLLFQVAGCAGGSARIAPPTVEERKEGCGLAYDQCDWECKSLRTLFDLDDNAPVDTFRTSYRLWCQEACLRGYAACEEKGVEEFYPVCRSACVGMVWDEMKGELRFATDAEMRCADACSAGRRATR